MATTSTTSTFSRDVSPSDTDCSPGRRSSLSPPLKQKMLRSASELPSARRSISPPPLEREVLKSNIEQSPAGRSASPQPLPPTQEPLHAAKTRDSARSPSPTAKRLCTPVF